MIRRVSERTFHGRHTKHPMEKLPKPKTRCCMVRNLFLIASFLLLTITLKAQYPSFVWGAIANSGGADHFADVAVDQAGNVYAVGAFELDLIIGTDTFPHPVQGNSDVMFVKYDASGHYLWGQHLGGAGSQEVTAIVVSPQNEIYITGRFSGASSYMGSNNGVPQYLTAPGAYPAYLSKFDTTGNLLWTRTIAGSSFTWAFGLAIDQNNEVMLTGTYWPDLDFGNGITLTAAHQMDLFVARFNSSNGTCTFAMSEGGHNADWSYDIAVDNNGNFAIAGSFDDTLLLSGNTLVAKGLGDAFVACYTPAGTLKWFDHTGGYSTQTITSDAAFRLAFDSNNQLWVTGFYQDTMLFDLDTLISSGFMDIFLAQYDTTGGVLQTMSLGGASMHDGPSDIAVDNLNNVYLAGNANYNFTVGDSTYYTSGMNDVMAMKFDPNLQLQWLKMGGSPYNDGAGRMTVNALGDVYLTASIGDKNPIVFDTILLPATATEMWYEAVLVKISSYPEPSSTNEWPMEPGNAVYPNPTSGIINLVGKEEMVMVRLFDVTGREVMHRTITLPATVDLSALPNGLYQLTIPAKGQSYRVIKQ